MLLASILTTLTLAAFGNAAPLAGDGLEKRAVNCTNMGASYDTSCYATLDITAYLDKWNKTTPVCGASDDDSACCQANEPWSTCFLRLATGTGNNDCTQIGLNRCALSQIQLAPGVESNPDIAPQVRYVVWTIYNINSFFVNWYQAVANAVGQANTIISPIVQLVDPPKKTNVLLSDILTAFSAGLAFLGLPEVSGAVSATAGTVGNIINTSLQQAPGVSKAIWPSGTANSQQVQISNLESSLGTAASQIETSLNNGLAIIMDDVPSFTGFAGSGSFSGSTAPSLPADTQSISLAFSTYLVTAAMNANDWILTTGPTASQIPSSAFGCTNESSGVCACTKNCDVPNSGGELKLNNGWSEWTSSTTGKSYYASQEHNKNSPNSVTMTNALASNGWTSLQVAFDGARNCSGQPVLNIASNGTLDLACFNQLSVAPNGCGWVGSNPSAANTTNMFFNCCPFFDAC